MNTLVIGGTRFVGLRLVRELAQQSHNITLLNRGKTAADLPAGMRRLYADRRDAEAIKKALEGQTFDAVFDFTGYQLRGMEPIVEALAGKVGHFLFQSTCGVYAESDLLPTTEDAPLLDPHTALTGAAAYEAEKVQCEDYLLQAHRERGFPVTILRAPMVFGPENWMHDREFSFFVRMHRGLPVLVPGNGETFLHAVHVDDVAGAHLAALGHQAAVGQTYNIATAQAITVNGYLDVIAGIVGAEPRKVYLDLTAMSEAKSRIFPFPWQKSTYRGIAKAKEQLGWAPSYDWAGGLRHTYEWWREALGIEQTRFAPGKLGYDVNLAYEAELAQRYG